MHDIFNYSPPPAASSDESDSESEGGGGAGAGGNRYGTGGKGGADPSVVKEGVVVLGDTPDSAQRKTRPALLLDDDDDEEFHLVDTPHRKPVGSKKRKNAKQVCSQEKLQKTKMHSVLTKNAATVAALRGEKEDNVQGMVRRLKNTAARERQGGEERRRREFQASAPVVVGDGEGDDLVVSPGFRAPTAAVADEGAGNAGEKIKIKVVMPNGKDKHAMRLSMTDKFEKVFKKLRELLPAGQDFALDFDGDEVTPESTPQGLDVEDEDQIDVILKR